MAKLGRSGAIAPGRLPSGDKCRLGRASALHGSDRAVGLHERLCRIQDGAVSVDWSGVRGVQRWGPRCAGQAV